MRPADARIMPGPLGTLQLQLATMVLHAPGHVGVMIEDLTTGLRSSVNANVQMPAASTIKIPVMVEVFRRLALGDFDLNRHVTLRAGDRDWGWGDLADAHVGRSFTVSRLLTLMITESDNTATNMLIRLVGRSAINRTMIELGLSQTRLGDFIRSEGPIAQQLRSSPRDMIHLLAAMAQHRLVDEWSSRAMIAILAGQHHNTLLPQPLPAGTTIAHKTGSLHDTLNDVGIVFLDNEPYAIAVMTTQLPTLDAGRRFIRGVSRLAYDELSRFADWRATNGMPALLPPEVEAAPALSGDSDIRRWSGPEGNAQPSALPNTVTPLAPAAGVGATSPT